MSFSVRIVNADLYTAAPLPGFDCLYSTFRESKVIKVPVIRIFGSTPNGQRTCLHVHGVFPYIFIPYDGSQPTQNYLKQFATSVDFAVHVSMGKASSSTRHVHDIVIVKARPYYGYHEEEREFMKISFYNPFVVPRVVSLLQNGAIMNKVFQPHESHIPYIQQMFIDYNLYGMNLLHASAVKFRTPLRLKQEDESSHTAHVPDFSPSTFNSCKTTPSVFWSEENIPSHWIHDPEVERLSISELEVDVKAEDILNQIDIESNIGTSPGLAAIWEEERERRRNENDDIPVTLPVSQDRGDLPLLEAEAYYKEKIRQIIGGRDLEMQTSPVHNKEGQIPSPLLKRNSEQEDVSSPSYHDASVDEPIVDESIVQEVVQSSQRMLSQDIVSSTDMEMVKMLVSLEDDDGDDVESHSSQLLKIPVLSPPPMRELMSDEDEAEAEEAEKDEEESILMSQQVWDDTDPDGQDEEESILMSQQVWDDTDPDGQDEEARVSQFDLEGLDESWEISQLDGVNDDDSGVTKQSNTSRRSGRLGMSSIRIPIKPCKANDKKQHVEKGNSTPSNEPATHPMFSLQLSETSSSEGENLEEHSGRDTREGEDSKMLVGKRPKESPISYEAIRSLVFTGYSKSTTRKSGKRKEKKLTKVKSAVMEKSRLSSPRRSLRNHEDRKEQNRRYKLRNTNPSCSKVADNTRTPDGSTVMTGSYDVERTSLDQPCGDQCLGNSIPLSRQGCRTKLLPDLKVVLDNIAFSQDLREVFVAALKRKKASLQKLKANLHRPLSSSDNEAMSTNVVVSRQPTIKKQTPARRSPKSKRYGVLDITVHTSPLKEKNAVATEHALPTRRRLVDQLEHVDSPLNRLYRNNSVMTSDELTRIHERGVKRNSSEIISHQDNNKRLCLKLKKKTELTSVVGSNEDATTEEEFIGCLKAVQTRQDDNGKEGPLITTGGGEDRVDIRHQVTCIPSSPLEDLDQSRHVAHAPSLLQQPADTGLLNGALFNMSFLSPCAFESDKSSSPPSPSTPTKDRVNNSCKSIADRHSTKPSFDDALLNVPDDRISKGSDANNRVGDHWVRQPQVEEQSPHYLLRLSNEPNRTQDQQQDEPMNTLDVSSGTTFITKGEKISCLNAIRQYCLLLQNIKRALLGDIDEEGLMVHKDHTPPYTLPVATCTSNRLSIKESDQNAGSATCPVQDLESDHYTVSVTHSTSKELSTQDKKSDGHTVSVTHSTSKELSTQDKKSDGHTVSVTHSTSKELSTQDKKSDGHTVSQERETDEEEQRLFSGVSSDSRSRNSFGLFDEPPSGQSSDNCRVVAVLPGRKPPTTAVLMETLEDYGIARCRHQQPYYSNPNDVPENTMDVGGRLLKVQSQTLKHLPEFDTRSPVVGIRDWRQLLCADHECHQDMGGAEGFVKEIENNPRLRLAFMGDKPVVVTPCKIPPSPLVVSSWAKDKLMKYKERKKQSDDGNDGEQRKSELKLSDNDADISDATHQQERTNSSLLFSHTDKGKTPEKDEASPTSMNEYLGHQSQDRCTASAYRERSPSTPSGQLRPRIASAPQHSTPILSHHNINPSQLPILTPINLEATDKSPKESTDRSPGVIATQTRRQSIPSQLKFVTPDTRLRRCVEAGSDIEGPSPINTGGFKMPQMNMRDSKPSHEVQHVTLLSIELHVRTRKDLRPDPEFDPVCAIFFHAQTDSPLPAGKNKLTGIICVCKESSASDLCTSTTRCQDEEKRPLLGRSGVTQYVIQYAQEEKELFGIFLQLVRKWDPDILIGYEVQMLSWGYLIQRALVFDLDLCKMLSRVTGSSSECNMDAEKDMWGAAHASELRIAGRIVLNVWRLMRHEVALNTYTFENVAFHVLHERIPLFTYRTLSDWWDHKIDVHRWRTVNHYITRCHGNVRILEQVDFIGRTSELSRLFGILFYSVISRGSQFRVESMMLRIAKPMNYIPLSPSHQQIRNMCAPEVIPLVMEPESRFYSDPVLVLDFQSLYPSIVIAYNYCYSTCLGRVARLAETGEFKFGASSLSVPSTLLKKLEDDIHVSPNGVAFVKPRVRRGVLPRMLEDILNTRIMVKNSMKKWKNNKSVHRMLDARQLGLKLIANVTFGYTAANFSGRMPCVEISDSIIRKARETLEYAIKLVNNTSKWGARVVYGDTDSMFVLLKGVTKEEAFRIGQEIVDTVTSLNPKPVKLKFEKVYLPCVLQTKKRYVGYMYETLDQKEPVFDAKGIETVRRDTCPAVAKVLEKSLRIMFETKDISLVKRYVKRQFTKVFQGRISLQDLTFAKEYRGMSSYQPGACVPALELTRRMLKEDRRSEPRVGERVPYVVTYGTPGLPLIRLVKRPLEVLQDSNLRINAMYYITKQMIPPLNRVLTLIGVDVNNWFADVPRIARVRTQPFANSAADIPKKTISHYFYKTNCPVCQEITSGGLCETCSREPQKVLVILQDRLRRWRRTYHNLTQVCYQCCATSDPKLCCVSIDCPVFHKLIKSTRDLHSEQYLRQLLEGF